jgi:hypothetical protein
MELHQFSVTPSHQRFSRFLMGAKKTIPKWRVPCLLSIGFPKNEIHFDVPICSHLNSLKPPFLVHVPIFSYRLNREKFSAGISHGQYCRRAG